MDTLQQPVTLSRADAWSRTPRERMAALRAEVQELERRARLAPADATLARDLEQRRRYMVTFRRQHRI